MIEQQNEIKFIPYNDRYHVDLKRLTLEWIEKYLYVEPEDEEFMENPQGYILDGGGFIFMAEYNGEVVGTVSLCKLPENKFELCKLAVTEKYKGLKLGRHLMQLAIDKCVEINATQIILYTTKRLEAAYKLYLQLGFVEIVQERQKYIEAEVKMVLDLK